MAPLTAIFLGIIGIIWLSWLWSRRKYYYMHVKIKGPLGYPLIGSGLEFLDQTKLLNFLGRMKKKFGPTFFGFLGTQPCFIISDPKIIEEIFTHEQFIDKMDIYNVINDVIHHGLFSAPKEKWTRSRKHINKAFVHKVLLSFYPIFNKQVRELCQVFDKFDGKEEQEIYPIITKVQIDTAFLTTMGQRTNFLNGDNPELLHSYETIIAMTSARLFNPILKNKFFFKYLYPKRHIFQKADKIAKSNCLKLLQEKLYQIQNANLNEDPDSSPEDEINITKSKSIFIDIMVREYLAGNFTFDEVKVEMNTMIVAAYETTTNTLFYTLMLLAMNPQYQEKLYDEIISIISDDDNVFITPEHVQQLVYTEMIMNETMRLISPVPLIGRNASQDIVLKNGMFIAKDTNVIIDIFDLHRDEATWGPNAHLVFDPDNFLKHNILKKHPYAFIPFTKGIRNCIGWRYAIISYKIMLAHLIRRYKFETTFKFEDLVYSEQVVIKFKEYPKLKITRRKSQNI